MGTRYTFSTFQWDDYDAIQDPIYYSYLDVNIFIDSYRALMESLDGLDCDSYIDSFFKQSVINARILVFIDEDARLDFEDLSIEMNLIPSLKEICEGETKHEKDSRKTEEDAKNDIIQKTVEANKRSQNIQKEKTKNKKILTGNNKAEIRQKQMLATMIKLRSKLNNESDPAVIAHIKKKMNRINELLDYPVTI